MRVQRLTLLLGTVLIVGSASTVFSQATQAPPATITIPTYEVAAGYQFLRLPDQNFPFGLAVDGVRHTGPFGLAGEVGWSRYSDDEFGADFTVNMFHLAAGPRWTGFGSGRAWPYAQVLAGAAIARSSLSLAGIDTDDTETAFMIQPGVGVTFVAGDGWGIFGQADYRRTFSDDGDGDDDDDDDDLDDDGGPNNQFRVFAGFRMMLD